MAGHAYENPVGQNMERVRQKLCALNERQTLSLAASLGLIGRPELPDKRLLHLERSRAGCCPLRRLATRHDINATCGKPHVAIEAYILHGPRGEMHCQPMTGNTIRTKSR